MDTKLTTLSIRGFRSFQERATIDFPDHGLFNLKGVNHDTGGCSGSGKSSLILAISYALGYCPFPATALKSWGSEVMDVSLTMSVDGKQVVIGRGDGNNGLNIEGEKKITAVARINEKLAQTIGLSPELLSALTYRGQKQPGLFLSKTDSEKKEFLSSLLGLDRIEEAVEEAKERLKQLEARASADKESIESHPVGEEPPAPEGIANLEQTIFSLQKNIQKLKAGHLDSVAQLDRELAVPRQDLRSKLAVASRESFVPELTQDFINLTKTLQEVKERVQRAMQADADRHSERRAELAALNAALRAAQAAGDRVQRIAKEIKGIDAEIMKLAEQVCPTCDQFWMKAGERVKQLKEQKVKLDAQALKEQLVAMNAEVIESDIELASLPLPQDPIIAKLLALQMSFQAQVAAEQQKMASGQELFKAQRDARIAQIQNEIAALEENYRAEEGLYTISLQQMQEGLDKLRIRHSEAQHLDFEHRNWETRRDVVNERKLGLADTMKELNKERDFIALVGREGFLGSIFDEILEEIANETNKMLAAVPNVSHVTLRFKSETVTQKGTIKRSIVPCVSIGGHEAPWESGLSGGMATALELATDLAVATVISRRTGHSPKWLILDEAFEGLGALEKEACLAILKQHAADKLVIIVDHMGEFQEQFTSSITVELTNGKSSVQ